MQISLCDDNNFLFLEDNADKGSIYPWPFVQHWNTMSLSSQHLHLFSMSLKQWCVEGLLLPTTVMLWWPFPQHSFFSVSLWHPDQPPGLSCLQHMCWSHSEGQLSLTGCICFKLTSVFNAFPQFQSYLCRVLQKPSGALLSRKSVGLLSESVRLISFKNKALGLGVVGGVAKEASLVLQEVALPTKLLSFVIAKDKTKQTQVCAVAPRFPCSL